MDFALTEDEKLLVDVADRVGKRLAPGYLTRDQGTSPVSEVFEVLADAGLLGLSASEESGGQGASAFVNGLVVERLAAADWTAAGVAGGSPGWLKLLENSADDELRAWIPELMAGRRWLSLSVTEQQSGSDTTNIKTKAVRDGADWVITGEKNSMSWPTAHGTFVLGKTVDGGSAMFFVPLDRPGVTVSELGDVGSRGMGRAVLTLDSVRVPEGYQLSAQGQGLRALMQNLSVQKVFVALACVGNAQAALDDAIEWARHRETFGAPLATRQGVAHQLVDHVTRLEMARLLCYKALWKADGGLPFRREAAMVKATVPRWGVDACHDAMLVIGHTGFSTEHTAQLRLRDSLGGEFGEGPEHIQKNLVARDIFGVRPG